MGLIVQKFGGSSVANAERVNNVARIVTDTYKAGNDVVVVVSAQGDTTDDLIEKAKEINPHAAAREMDQLLTAGEQISISLLAMAIERMGFPVISLLGWQAGFNTNAVYGAARIKNIKPNRLQAELAKRNIVVVAGFQGLNRYDDLTTLGYRCCTECRQVPDLYRCGGRIHCRSPQGGECAEAERNHL